MAEMNVLMVGGRRSGKTSALAAIFRTMQEDTMSRYFTVVNMTENTTKQQDRITEVQDDLNSKSREMKRFAEKSKIDTSILVDAGPTQFDWQYLIKFSVPGKPNTDLNMTFTDVPGEWCTTNDRNYNHFLKHAKKADVFVIAIDTPYLMGPTNEETRLLCGEEESELATLAGCMSDLKQTFSDIDNQNNKLVLFVPIKCEKWFNAGRIDDVNRRITVAFKTLLDDLLRRTNFTVGILPILTIGSIEFAEFHDPKYLNSVESSSNRCCKIDDTSVRMADGSIRQLDGNNLIDDPNWAFPPPDDAFLRPSSWYQCVENKYAPVNCEQLALHILRFMVYNTQDLRGKALKSTGSFFEKLKILIEMITEKFGGMGEVTLKEILTKMKADNLFLDEDKGITYLSNPLNIK